MVIVLVLLFPQFLNQTVHKPFLNLLLFIRNYYVECLWRCGANFLTLWWYFSHV